MSDTFNMPERIVTRSDLGDDDAALWDFWMGEDEIAGREEEKWHKRGRKISKRYRDERPNTGTNSHRLNILWSNVQTLMPTLYARTPKPDVQRRFLDQDPTGRLASLLLERTLTYSLEKNFDPVMKAVVQDRLLPGRGVARVMYVPHFGDPIKSPGADEYEEQDAAPDDIAGKGDEEEAREVVDEEVTVTYVFWEDYREAPARTWQEMPWVRYRAYMTRDQLVERFGAKGKKVNLDFAPRGSDRQNPDKAIVPPDMFKKAIVHEYWDKTLGEVVWLAPGTPGLILDRKDDPLGLAEFFPSPDPLLATTTTDSRIPVPDYVEYQDQAEELDKLTARIDTLTRALKVSGVYPGSQKHALQQLIDEGTENRLIPVEDWAAFSDKGGLDGMIQWLPIKEIAETLIQLYEARDKIKDLLYEITGIGDIMRGQTEPTETLGAQQLKANFSTRRIAPQQKEVATFARDIIRLMAGVISAHFDPKTISRITGYPQLQPVPQLPPPPPQVIPGPPQAALPQQMPPGGAPAPGMVGPPAPQMVPNPAFQQWQQAAQQAQAVMQANAQKQQAFDEACALIKSDGLHGFKLDIEADSTIAPDEDAERMARVNFVQQMIPFMEKAVPIAQGNPTMAALVAEVGMFAVRGFRVARTLEEAFEKAFTALGQMPAPPPKGGATGTPQNPAIEQAKVQADMHDTNMKAQTEMAAIAQKDQQAQDEMQMERERMAAEDMHTRMQMGIEMERMHSTERVQNARVTATNARGAAGLV